MRAPLFTALLCLGGAAALPAAAEMLTRDAVVSEQGVGPIRMGMTLEEAEAAAGVSLVGDPYEVLDDGSCYFVNPEGALGGIYSFMVAAGTIVRLDVFERDDLATAEGARVGDSEQSVLALYPDAIVEQHPYGDAGDHYVRTTDASGTHGYIFETYAGTVASWRAGRYPEIEMIEGCL